VGVTRLQRWLLIGIAVVLAAFVTGLVRGMTGTVPVEFESSGTSVLQP
jgi:FlaG/FlaF family flagellin (archaellin)